MGIIKKLRIVAKNVRRILKLSPMHKIFRSLKRCGVMPETLVSLEVFGSDGQIHTHDFASTVANLEIWEIRPEVETVLKRRFPKSEIKITDSYEEIKQTPKKFDLVVVDNPCVGGNHYEHFDLFPDIFRVLNDPAIIILIVMPKIPLNSSAEWLKQRQSFYNCASPTNITLDEIEGTYRNLAAQNGWVVENPFFAKRWNLSLRHIKILYVVLRLTCKDKGASHKNQHS